MIEKPKKSKHIWEYMTKLGYDFLSASMMDEVLNLAVEDEITDLVLSKEDYGRLRLYLIGSGIASWNWDRETVYGIRLCIR